MRASSGGTYACLILFSHRNFPSPEKHFIWTTDGLKILGISAIGRATCQRLDFNDRNHDEGAILIARQFWVEGGWHPPVDDPRLVSTVK